MEAAELIVVGAWAFVVSVVGGLVTLVRVMAAVLLVTGLAMLVQAATG